MTIRQAQKIISQHQPWQALRSRRDFVYIFPNEPLMRGMPEWISKESGVEVPFLSIIVNRNYTWVNPAVALQQAGQLFFHRVYEKPSYELEFWRKFKKKWGELKKFLRKFDSLDIDHATKRTSLAFYSRYIKKSSDIVPYGLLCWLLLEPPLGEYLRRYLIDKVRDERQTEDVLSVLSQPLTPTAIYQEKSGLFRILDALPQNLYRVVKYEEADIIEDKLKSNILAKKLINKHIREFSWIPFEYIGPHLLGWQDVIKGLKEILSHRNWRQAYREHINYYLNLRRQQTELFQKYRIDRKHQRLFKTLQHLSVYFDFRKEVFTKICLSGVKFYKKIGSLSRINPNDLLWLSPEEVEVFIREGELDDSLINLRKRASVVIFTQQGVGSYEGEKAERLIKLVLPKEKDRELRKQQLEGKVAFRGKIPRIQGKARILISPQKVNSMRAGEILVAAMTNPAYLSAMRKAKAIITDEGGLTCHAAIVSRELGIPCIVGTKISTQVLKDGDLVEVDAKRGIVRRLKKG